MRQNWTSARDFGRLLSNLTYLTEATSSDLSLDDVIPILNTNAIRAGEQPKRVTVGLLSSLITAANGVPSGGTTGQILSKNSNTNYDTTWVDLPASLPGGSSGELQFNDGGSFSGVASSSVDVDGNVTLRTATVNAPSGYTGNPFDVQIAGSSKLKINSAGNISFTNGAGNFSTNGYFLSSNFTATFTTVGNSIGRFNASEGLLLTTTTPIAWVTGLNTINTADLRLERDAADTLAQRRTTNAQTYRLYNTYTSSTNYERANLGWNGNVFLVGTEKGSAGGTARQLELQTDGTSKVAITTDGKVGIGTTAPSASLELDAPSGYTGNLLDLQVDGTSKFTVDESGNLINGSAATDINGQTEIQSALDDELIIYDTSTSTNKKALVRDIGCQGMGGWGISSEIITNYGTNNSNTGTAFAVDRIYYIPLLIPQKKTFNTFAVRFGSTTGSSSNVFRLGLYTMNNGFPGSLILDAGSVACGGANNSVREISINLTLEAGFYYTAYVTNDSALLVNRQNSFITSLLSDMTGLNSILESNSTHLYENLAGSAASGLPSTAASPISKGAGNHPVVFFYNV